MNIWLMIMDTWLSAGIGSPFRIPPKERDEKKKSSDALLSGDAAAAKSKLENLRLRLQNLEEELRGVRSDLAIKELRTAQTLESMRRKLLQGQEAKTTELAKLDETREKKIDEMKQDQTIIVI